MGKNLNVNLTFTANTQQAKMQIRDLQTALNSITSGVTSKVGLGETITQDLQKANQAAMQLKVALRSATDVKTGNIDLYKLDQIFKANKMSVEQYRVALQGAGVEGQKAFAQLNQAITNAQMPIRKTSTMIDSMWTTMKNTMRWQLTSSMLMGFTSAIRKAYGYAQDLNESLNNIRIVTGYNTDKMDKFAISANKAAKALNTTTTAYTDAALIYYQQGLSDEEVLKRTNVTVKLANVSRESAETVSEWMTSIWNNFDDGSKTLEHYADVMTALGAATASSSDEIATGIEKFSAVAKNVGLSYEYAASALATVTAQTRQSADVVGTAFKTLFTRITDLELGKGLDDGTTLGQYSQTLSDIGVNIKTSTGELRSMDAILNDLGARWDNLNKATQQAVAQSVAGIRQSNQFIALMDNWDFFQQNLQTSLNSQGALQDQADIYAESWEAASKRVTAAAEGLYDSILNDDFFIEITNGFADLIEFVEMAVDAMGGLKGLLPGVLALMLQLFGNKMLTSVREFSTGLKASGTAAEKVALGLKADSAQAAKNMAGGSGSGTHESMAFGTNMEEQGKIQEKTWALSKNLSETEKLRLQNLEQLNQEQREQTLELAKQTDELTEQAQQAKNIQQAKEQEFNKLQSKLQGTINYEKSGQADADLETARSKLLSFSKKQNDIFDRNAGNDLTTDDFSKLQQAAQGNKQATQAVNEYIQALQKRKQASQDAVQAEQQLDAATDSLIEATNAATEADRKKTEAIAALNDQTSRQKQSYQNTITYLNQLENSVDWGQSVVSLATGFSQLAMGISSLQSLGSIWENSDLSTGEKLLQTVMSLGMGLSTLVFSYKQIHSAINADTISQGINTLARYLNTKQAEKQAQQSKIYKDGIIAENQELDKNTGKQIINKASKEVNGNKYSRHNTSKGVLFRNDTTNRFISVKDGVNIFGPGSDQSDWVPEKAGFKDKASYNISNFKQSAKTKWGNFKGGVQKFGPSIGYAAGALAALAAAATAAVGAIVLIQKALNKEENALKAATESAKRFREEHQRVSDETQKLKDNISSYKDAVSGLNELTKGTIEYREALLKANEQALELIKNNRDLEYSTIDGQIVINQASMDRAYENQLKKQEDALMASSVASQTANAARITNNNAAFAENMHTRSDLGQTATNTGIGAAGGAVAGAGVVTAGYLGGMAVTSAASAIGTAMGVAGSGAAAGAAAGSAFPVVGTIIGAVVGLIVGGIVGVVTSKAEGIAAEKEQEALERLQELSRDNPAILKDDTSVRNALKGVDEDILDALTEDMDTLRELIASNEALRQQNIALNSTIAQAIAKERGDEDYSQAITSYMNNRTIEDKNYNSDWETVRESIDEEDRHLQDLYELFYDKDTEGYLTGMAGNKVTRVTYDEKGKEVETEVSQETISSELTSKIKKAALEGDTATLKKVLELIKDSGSGTEVKDIIDKYTISAADLDAVIIRATTNAAKLVNSGFDKENDKNIINMLTGQLEGDLKEIDFSSLTREQLELIKQNQELWKSNSELNDKIQKGISEYEVKRTEKNLNTSIEFDIQQNESNELDKLLSKTETTATEFKTYQKIIQNEYKISEDNAYGLAKANLLVQSSITDLNKKITENSEVLDNNNKNNTQYAKAVSEISTAMTSWLGIELDSDFVEKHMKKIKAAAEGDKQAIKELQDLASQEFVINLDLKGEYENQLLDFTNTVNSTELTIGMTLDTTQATKNLGEFVNKMIRMGQMTTEQGVAYLQSMGFEIDSDDISETELTTSELWRSDATLWEKIKGTFTDKSVKTINMSTVQYSGEGKTADLSEIGKDKKDKKKDRLNSLKNEKDRYHEINEIISDTERNLDKLSKAKDRAFGKNKVAAIKDEIKAQKELIKNNKELLKEAQDYLKIDQKELIKNTASNLTIQFDEYGRIANYEALQNSYIKRLKAAAGNEVQYEKINEEYEQFKEAAERYEETLNKVEEQQEKVNDEFDRLSELHVEEIETKVEIKVEMADDDKAYIDFLMQKTEDDAFAAAERIGNYGGYAKAALTKIDAAQEGIDDTQRKLEAGEITPAQAVELMREYRQELIDGNAELLEIRNNVQDELTGIFEAFHEEIENGIEKLEHYGTVLNGYKNIIDIVGKGMLGLSDETMNTLNKAIVSNANDTIRAVKAQKDANDKTIAEMKQAREEAAKRGDDASVKEWDKQIEAAEAKGRELTTNLQDALTSGLEAAATAFGDTVDQIIDSFAKQVSGIYDSIEEMREAWDRSLEVADRYLQTYEKTYELNKLNRNIQKSIDNTDSLQAQKQLRGLQEEMYEMTKDGQQLSKYDLEYLQKKYDLLVAEQALKDAQNAKSVVRLQRDSEGNYGYVYTADQNAIDNAAQAYEDKLYAYQQWSANMDKELTELYISVNEKYVENIAWVQENFIEGTAEYQEHMDRVNREYQEDMAFITGENEKLINRNLAINQQFSAGVAATYKDTFLGQIQPNYNSFAELFSGTTDACEQATIQLNAAVIGLRGTFDEQFRLAGEDFDDFAKKADDKFGEIQDDSSDTADEIKDLADKMEIEMGNAIDAVEDFQIDYSKQMDKIRKQTDKTIKIVEALIEKYNKLIKKNEEANNLKTPTEVKGETKPKSETKPKIDTLVDDDKPILTTTPKNTVTDTKTLGNTAWYQVNNGDWYSDKALEVAKNGEAIIKEGQDIADGTRKIYKGDMVNLEKAMNKWLGKELELKQDITAKSQYALIEGKGFVDYDKPWYDPNGKVLDIKYLTPGNAYFKLQGKYLNDNKPIWLHSKVLGETGDLSSTRISFDTGGYTGEWGPEGRLAMLHQKEIVLNAHDTENLLTAVSMIREISSQLESNALAMQHIGSLGKVYSAIHTGGDTLQQEVHITAEFPNATDHNEIEEAFKNLTNLASQYANRKS